MSTAVYRTVVVPGHGQNGQHQVLVCHGRHRQKAEFTDPVLKLSPAAVITCDPTCLCALLTLFAASTDILVLHVHVHHCAIMHRTCTTSASVDLSTDVDCSEQPACTVLGPVICLLWLTACRQIEQSQN